MGAPKVATTSLHHYLDRHPQIYMSAIQEPHFFAPETAWKISLIKSAAGMRDREPSRVSLRPMLETRFNGIVTNWEDYEQLFANARDERSLGEASAGYLWSRHTLSLIAESVPTAQIIVRDPAGRAFSQYLHGRRQRRDPLELLRSSSP